MTATAPELLLTTGQAARLLGVCESTVLRRAKLGLLPVAGKVGKHHRFREADVRARMPRGGAR